MDNILRNKLKQAKHVFDAIDEYNSAAPPVPTLLTKNELHYITGKKSH